MDHENFVIKVLNQLQKKLSTTLFCLGIKVYNLNLIYKMKGNYLLFIWFIKILILINYIYIYKLINCFIVLFKFNNRSICKIIEIRIITFTRIN